MLIGDDSSTSCNHVSNIIKSLIYYVFTRTDYGWRDSAGLFQDQPIPVLVIFGRVQW